mgnify:CR=1 FL=1
MDARWSLPEGEIRSAREVLGRGDNGFSARLSTNGLSTNLKPLQLLYHSGVLLTKAVLPPKRERT